MTKSSQGKVLCKARSFDHDDVDANFDLAFDVSCLSFHVSDQYQSATLRVQCQTFTNFPSLPLSVGRQREGDWKGGITNTRCEDGTQKSLGYERFCPPGYI